MAASNLKTQRLEAGYLGIENDAAPAVVGKGKGRAIYNYLTGDKGRLRQRGPVHSTAIAFGTPGGASRISGILYHADRLFVGMKIVATTTATVEPWVAPYKPSAVTALAKSDVTGTNNIWYINLLTGTPTSSSHSDRYRSPGPNGARYGKFIYGITYDSNGDTAAANGCVLNGRGGFERYTRIGRWDLDVPTGPASYVYAPQAAQDLRFHYGRLMVVGGTDPNPTHDASLSPIRHNRIRYTRALTADDFNRGFSPATTFGGGDPDDTATTAWTDEISGAMNILDLPGSHSDFGVKFAAIGRDLAILKRNEVVVLSGYGPSTWQLSTAVQDIGCLDPRSVVELKDGVFFLSRHGYMFFDGRQVVDVSRGIHRLMLESALAAVGDNGTAGGYCIATPLSNDHILLSIGVMGYASSPADSTVTFCGLYHIPSNSWANFSNSTSIMNQAAPSWVGRSETQQFMSDDTTMYTINNITTPEVVAESLRGKDGAENINTIWISRAAELGAPHKKSILHRVIIDYEWAVDGDNSDETYTGPTVVIRDTTTGTAIDTYTLPSHRDDTDSYPELSTPLWRKRHVREVFTEANEVQIEIAYASTARALARSAIHDCWVEYEETHERSGSSNV